MKGALPSLWECDRCPYIRTVDASLSKSLSLSLDASNEMEKRASSVCSAVMDIFKSAAAGSTQTHVSEPVSLTVK
jgi:hypothetical protein